MDQTPALEPSIRPRWLALIAGVSGISAAVSTGLLAHGWANFDGDWDGPLRLVDGKSAAVWLVIDQAWTFLVPLIVVAPLTIVTTMGCMIASVVCDGILASRRLSDRASSR